MLRFLALLSVLILTISHINAACSASCGCPHCAGKSLSKQSINQSASLLRPRQFAPQFESTAVINGEFQRVSLSQYLDANRWVLAIFYPFDWTYVCPTELVSHSENINQFKALNTTVLGISTDSHHTHLAWSRTSRSEGGLGPVNFPLIGDVSKSISRSYGVLVEDENDPMYGAALRGTFIIDPTGKIRSVQINDDEVGRSYTEALRLIKGFQYSAAHTGEVCPASWKEPGDDTIVATPAGIKEFFARSAKPEL